MSADISRDRTIEQLYRDVERMKAENESLKAAIGSLRTATAEPATCGWREESAESKYWETGCDQKFTVTTGTPLENGMRFCPFCGKLIAELAFVEEPEEDEAE